MKRYLGLGLSLLLVIGATDTRAEPVLIMSGQDFGRGWLFSRNGQCFAATARHVVSSGQGLLISQAGVEGQISRLLPHPDSEVDLAVVEIAGRLARECPKSSVGYPDSRPVIASAEERNLELTAPQVPQCYEGRRATGQCGGITVKRLLIKGYNGRDRVFSVVPTGRDDIIRGDSGTAILSPEADGVPAGQPLGILFDTSTSATGSALAVVFSEAVKIVDTAIAVLARAAPVRAGVSGAALSPVLVDFRGFLPNPECGPLNALREDAPCPFGASPLAGKRSVDLVLTSRYRMIEFVEAEFAADRPVPAGMEIMSSDSAYAGVDQQGWTSVRYCRPSGTLIHCRFNITTPGNLLIRFAGPVALKRLKIGGQ